MHDKIIILKDKIKGAWFLFKNLPLERRILGVLLILFIGFILYQSLIAVQMSKLKAIDFQFASQKKLVNFYNQIMKRTDVFKKELKEKEKNLQQINQKFVDEEELSDYFDNFRELAKSHNLKVLTLDFKPQEAITDLDTQPLSYYQKLHFNVSLKGGYFDTMTLLYKLEHTYPKIFNIQSMHIKQESPQSYEVFTDMEAVIYISI